MEPDERTRRVALNESSFRAINDRVESDLRGLTGPDAVLEFVCECGHLDCREGIHLKVANYEQVRADPMCFVLVPGHEIPDVETVEAVHDGYHVVRKLPPARPVVEEQDSRRDR